ncbi:uridine-cytidine kinase 2-B-like [Tropilaelaps mercedesae]|uniref:Uridine-cytidine kinase 2-B-like n=1 Tax=Tropilaelaps mercedesae TaxID=418985 RepID=A0A1V9XM65_9ACAR|nr:uridine-cytidine kinase 2-B-like [Tropilaelaps mercedesae]
MKMGSSNDAEIPSFSDGQTFIAFRQRASQNKKPFLIGVAGGTASGKGETLEFSIVYMCVKVSALAA